MNVYAPPRLNSVYAGREKELRFQVMAGPAIVSNPTVVSSLTTEPGCVSPSGLPTAIRPADYGLVSLKWSSRYQRFSIHWLAPSSKGTTVTSVVTLADGTRIVACFLTK